jgi:predicted ABC-type sugar transport system permease subunit
VDCEFLGGGLLCHTGAVGGADGGCHITGVDGRMADPRIASAGLDGVWMMVVGLGGIASGAGGEHRAARVDTGRMGAGVGRRRGRGWVGATISDEGSLGAGAW